MGTNSTEIECAAAGDLCRNRRDLDETDGGGVRIRCRGDDFLMSVTSQGRWSDELTDRGRSWPTVTSRHTHRAASAQRQRLYEP